MVFHCLKTSEDEPLADVYRYKAHSVFYIYFIQHSHRLVMKFLIKPTIAGAERFHHISGLGALTYVSRPIHTDNTTTYQFSFVNILFYSLKKAMVAMTLVELRDCNRGDPEFERIKASVKICRLWHAMCLEKMGCCSGKGTSMARVLYLGTAATEFFSQQPQT